MLGWFDKWSLGPFVVIREFDTEDERKFIFSYQESLGPFVVIREFDTEDERKFIFSYQESAFIWILVSEKESFQTAK